jgi:hypothetical protein
MINRIVLNYPKKSIVSPNAIKIFAQTQVTGSRVKVNHSNTGNKQMIMFSIARSKDHCTEVNMGLRLSVRGLGLRVRVNHPESD